jgi:hypothetical protein
VHGVSGGRQTEMHSPETVSEAYSFEDNTAIETIGEKV